MSPLKKSAVGLVLFAFVGAAALAWGQGGYVGEPTSDHDLSRLPAALTQLLDPHGTSIKDEVNGIPTILCQVWWAKSIAAQKEGPKSRDVLYGGLRPGALVGVLHFPSEGEDAIDQKLKAGFYTLRYAQLTPDDETQEASHGRFRDFLVVSPASADEHPDQVLSLDELQKLSRLASRSTKPAIFPLVPFNPAYKQMPVVLTDGMGNCLMQVSLPGNLSDGSKSQPLEFAVILLTPPKTTGES